MLQQMNFSLALVNFEMLLKKCKRKIVIYRWYT